MKISKDQYYFKIVEAVALRATCNRGRSGAVIVKDGRAISAGYVGSPAKTKECDEIGHEMITRRVAGKPYSFHCTRTVHAETNALLQAARYGPPIDGAVMYCTMFPCYDCAKALINAGIVEVHAMFDYQTSVRSKEILEEAGVKWTVCVDKTLKYEEADRELDPG